MSEGQGTAKVEGPRKDEGSRPPDPLIGRLIADRFRITSLIARGGMGKVYRAEQAPLGRLCAIKVLNPSYSGDADPEFHRRFFREASITSKITHPNSVTIFDYGKTEDDIYFMAMEYLEGKTLHLALREGGVMHEIRAGRIASQICRALREAHKLGVIHRDLKPANIFLTRPNTMPPDGSGSIPPASEEDEDFVKVLDFGLVKHLSERPEEQLTQTGLFMGSPKYMAPEQIQGGHVDERTDIYSLGIIMYEMLAGKVPFERASSVNILMAHVGEPPPPMRAVNPNLVCSPAFEEIVMSCIAKSPDGRFASMDHVLQAIRRAHGGTLTGQITALNATGALAALSASQVPPGVSTGQLASISGSTQAIPPPPSAPFAASASSPALGSSAAGVMATPSVSVELVRADASNDIDTGAFESGPRSKLWIALGILVAAVLGGGLGMLAFRWTSPDAAPNPTPTVAPTPVAATPAPLPITSEAPPPQAKAAETKPRTVAITTDPPGAAVSEDGKEVCASTPCELTWNDGASAAAHRLRVTRAGYHSDTRTVSATDTALDVKLVRAARPAGARPSTKSDSETPEPPESTPDGFKAVPY
jgi:serine/threonine-protein kinase